jgi:hypothetical protein
MSHALTYIGTTLMVGTIYALLAGLMARWFRRWDVAHSGPGEYGGDACPRYHGRGGCECYLWAWWAAFWPLVFLTALVVGAGYYGIYRPIVRAARAGFSIGAPPNA